MTTYPFTRLALVSPNKYESYDGRTLSREFGQTPDGQDLDGQWVLRESNGTYIDHSVYRNDIAEKHELILIG